MGKTLLLIYSVILIFLLNNMIISSAQMNFVQNPGGETGLLDPYWTANGVASTGWSLCGPSCTSSPHTGSYSFQTHCTTSCSTLTQSITDLTTGQLYLFSCWAWENNAGNSVTASIDSILLLNAVEPPYAVWTYYSSTFTATSGTMTLTLSGVANTWVVYLDDIGIYSLAPTGQPTSLPSNNPTMQPTDEPTSEPTTLPSSIPSTQPTSDPSNRPSNRPTVQPSSEPSVMPSVDPSNQPSSRPSNQPSSDPSAIPSTKPSCQPSDKPSSQPTNSPSSQPSNQPTPVPSIQPSANPSSQPTSYPSNKPSSFPSCGPSVLPIAHPTNFPSSKPSNQPTLMPTRQPSSHPSVEPSVFPSSQPTNIPSAIPSGNPSTQPSALPFAFPSSVPTSGPSSQPSKRPSSRPLSQPSSNPTTIPTGKPSHQPSSNPSIQPISLPSAQPQATPTAVPTNQPSSVPSTYPTSQPTVKPTSRPSLPPTNSPSSEPTNKPSTCPTYQPTKKPSTQPTTQPTAFPSSPPPSCLPTSSPSILPSSIPSVQLRIIPSSQPSSFPTIQPSSTPSNIPTLHLTTIPSSLPSNKPSHSPTEKPTLHPTSQPSIRASSQFSLKPSTEPSNWPTNQPSSKPSMQPTGLPSAQPLATPNTLPTKVPTNQPSSIPSRYPTSPPSVQPTDIPSTQPSTYLSQHREAAHFSSTLSILIDSYSSLKEINFLFGINQYSSTAFRNILIPNTELLGESYLILGSRSFSSELDLSMAAASSSSKERVFQLETNDNGLYSDNIGSRAISFGGDFNDDSLSDLLIGDLSSSLVYVLYSSGRETNWQNVSQGFTFSDSSSVSSASSTRPSGFGWAVSSAGDFNADGIEDILISAIYSSSCYLVFGKPFMNLTNYNIESYILHQHDESASNGMIITISNQYDFVVFGVSVSGIADFNGDDYDDIAISGFATNGANQIVILFGNKASEILSTFIVTKENSMIISSAADSFIGLSITGLPDTNGDGFGDLLIGSIPYSKGYSTQYSYLIYGKSSYTISSSLSIENTTQSEGVGMVMKGGGIVVSSVGDVNNDGLADMMVSNYLNWNEQIGAYLVIYPTKLDSMKPTVYPSSSPSYSPSALEIASPSNYPSSYSTVTPPEQVTEGNSTNRPTYLATRKPTYQPSLKPSKTIQPLKTPPSTPSFKPTSSHPTFTPSTHFSSLIPSHRPSSFHFSSFEPSSEPSLSSSTEGKTILISSGGYYHTNEGNETIIIASSQDMVLQGNKGMKRYVIAPTIICSPVPANISILLEDFVMSEDIIDLSQWPSSMKLLFVVPPLTIYLSCPSSYCENNNNSLMFSNQVNIVLVSHDSNDLTSKNILFPSATASSSDSSSWLQSLQDSLTSFFSMEILIPLSALLFLTLGLISLSYVSMALKRNKKRTIFPRDIQTTTSYSMKTPALEIRNDRSFHLSDLYDVEEDDESLQDSDFILTEGEETTEEQEHNQDEEEEEDGDEIDRQPTDSSRSNDRFLSDEFVFHVIVIV